MNEGEFLSTGSHLLAGLVIPLITLLLLLWKLGRIERVNVSNMPLQVKMHEEFASRKEFLEHKESVARRHDEHAREISAIYRKLESDKEEIISAGEDRAVKIHDRINVIIEKLGEVRGEMKGRHA